MRRPWREGCASGIVLILLLAGGLQTLLAAQRGGSEPTLTPQTLVERMVANEDAEAAHRGHFTYVSEERSDRTGGHLWRERIAETNAGKVRMLIAEDGRTITGDRAAVERARLADIAAHPELFEKREQARKNDEEHAKQMLDLLPKAFVLENLRPEGEFVRIDFRPRPEYQARSLEERILHSMHGSLLVEPKLARLRSIQGRLPQDVAIGFGIIATIEAGSSFETTRQLVPGGEWKTHTLNTDIDGRAIFFKSIGKKEHAEHSTFRQIPPGMTVPEAVALLEREDS